MEGNAREPRPNTEDRLKAVADVSGRILVVDDEAMVRRMLERILAGDGHEVYAVDSVEGALELLERDPVDLILTDLQMPGRSGLDLLRSVKKRALDIPVIFLTGQPSVDSAANAVELGAFRYLLKPIAPPAILRAVREALYARTMVRAADPMRDRKELDRAFQSALSSLWIAFQPIMDVELKNIFGYEALLRSREPALPHPGAVIEAAEKLGCLHVLGRTVRKRVAKALDNAEHSHHCFVNVHPVDLADPDLYDREAPLSRHARRVVLEITERATLEGVADLGTRLAELRALGYRIAVDDLGAGYAGLSYFASLRPDLIKIDMSLVRDVDSDAVKQQVVLALASLGRSMGIEIVGEGIETQSERDALVGLQCTHLQGFLFAKPGPPFPEARWEG